MQPIKHDNIPLHWIPSGTLRFIVGKVKTLKINQVSTIFLPYISYSRFTPGGRNKFPSLQGSRAPENKYSSMTEKKVGPLLTPQGCFKNRVFYQILRQCNGTKNCRLTRKKFYVGVVVKTWLWVIVLNHNNKSLIHSNTLNQRMGAGKQRTGAKFKCHNGG